MDAEPKPSVDDASQSGQSEAGFGAGLLAEQSEMLGKFLLAPVPRVEIAPEIRRAAGKGRVGMTIMLLLVGMFYLLMSWLIISNEIPRMSNDWKLDREHREVTGVITGVNVTRQTQRRGGVSYRYEYAFEFIPDGSTGTMPGRYHETDSRENAARWHAGDKVQIWYLPDNTAVARIKGTHLEDPIGLAVGIILLVFSCALCGGFCWSVIRSRKNLEWLLANGPVGEFRMTSAEWVSVGKSRKARVRVECERVDDKMDDGCYRGVLFKQPEKKMKLAQSLKDSGRTVFGLYDPRERERGKKRRRLEIPETWFW